MHRKLKAYRQMFGFNQENVAKHLGISLHAYHNKETGKTPFTINEAKKLADLFETTVDDIFFNDNVPKLGTKSTA